jgi:hypothetical protein
MIDNEVCDWSCFNEDNNWDGKDCFANVNVTACTDPEDCLCAPGCTWDLLNNNVCEEACNVTACGFDWMDCRSTCKCDVSLILNGKCDSECNIEECEFDLGACTESCKECPMEGWFKNFDT